MPALSAVNTNLTGGRSPARHASQPRMLSQAKLCGQVAGVAGRSIKNNMYFTYVLRSRIDNNLYVGWTDDLRKRFEDHNKGNVLSTKSRKPFELEYYEACRNKMRAIKREKYFKTGFGRRFLKNRI